jgi:tagaturonate epimerase
MTNTMTIYEKSMLTHETMTYALARLANGEKRLVIEGETPALSKAEVAVFQGILHDGKLICEPTPANAAALRARLPWLNPVPLGVRTSFGFGDRIGLATPGHVAALAASGGHIAPIFAQQSVRENTRIGRTPQQVLDDAVWGMFEKGGAAIGALTPITSKKFQPRGSLRAGRLHLLHHRPQRPR